MYKWNNRYPANCPKAEAIEQKFTEVYRFVISNPPDEKDFLPHAVLRNDKKPECNLFGISFFVDKKTAEIKQNQNLAQQNKYIAKGWIAISDGTTKLNDEGHINLWMYENVQLHQRFIVE